MTDPTYVFEVRKDSCPDDFIVGPHNRANHEAYFAGRVQVYGVICIREHDAKQLAAVWLIVSDPGHEGTYRSPADIKDEALQGTAYGMLAGLRS